MIGFSTLLAAFCAICVYLALSYNDTTYQAKQDSTQWSVLIVPPKCAGVSGARIDYGVGLTKAVQAAVDDVHAAYPNRKAC